MVKAISSKEVFDEELKNAGSKLVVVDFFATWCGPCKVIAPKVEGLDQEMQDVVFLKVDVDQCEEVAMEMKISCMPTFIFFKEGKKVAEFSGADIDKLKETIAANR